MGRVGIAIGGGGSFVVRIVGIASSESTVSGPFRCLGKLPAKRGIGCGHTEEISILETTRAEGGDEMNVNVRCGNARHGRRGRGSSFAGNCRQQQRGKGSLHFVFGEVRGGGTGFEILTLRSMNCCCCSREWRCTSLKLWIKMHLKKNEYHGRRIGQINI